MKMMTFLTAAAFAFSLCTVCGFAQETVGPKPEPSAAETPVPPPTAHRQHVGKSKLEDKTTKELISAVIMGRLAKELDLKPEETALMVQSFETFKDKVQNIKRQRAEMVKELKAAVAANVSDEEISTKLERLIELDKKIADSRLEFFRANSQNLPPSKKAKLYFFAGEFENDMKKLMMNARERKMQQMRGEKAGNGAEKIRERLKERGEVARQRRNAVKTEIPPQPTTVPPAEKTR